MKNKMFIIAAAFLMLSSASALAGQTITYPSRAWHLDQSGSVTALYDVGKNGKADNVRIVESEPKYLFDDSVRKQIYSWRFPKGEPRKDVKIKVIFKKDDK